MLGVVEQVVGALEKMNRTEIQAVVDRFVESQVLSPGQWRPIGDDELAGASARNRLLAAMVQELEACRM